MIPLLVIAGAAIIGIIAAALLLALYWIRIEICGHIERYGRACAAGSVRWGLIGVHYRSDDPSVVTVRIGKRVLVRHRFSPAEEPEEPAPAIAAPTAATRLPSPAEARRMLGYVKKPLAAFLRSLSIRQLLCCVRLGTGEPCSTGMIYGWFWALKGMLSPADRIRLHMEPDFCRPALEGECTFAIGIEHPLLVLFAVLQLLAVSEVRGMLREAMA
ncbi:MAG: DUF2953 domain-containing protein [Methanomicrobiales archaeon]|nr:DUF2953 domain-containing protein [Methanomicrobiales archaeon]